ncbi:hypothetical protein [Sphingobium sp. EP60837]|uniref:hypothetical protein n=1 Tax=Sphingobium sp. EP60837 TaxID=1855519 RepID=UPI0007DCCA5A|nr:hypothetical protein [Sphingobium sp. EP60837]ANI76467.1 hypothetical protein EP837_00008 [Sphingobium sp. EP60837]
MTTTEAALREALEKAQDHVCMAYCHFDDPSREATRHQPICDELRAALSQPSPASSTAQEADVLPIDIAFAEDICAIGGDFGAFPSWKVAQMAAKHRLSAALSSPSGEPASVAAIRQIPYDPNDDYIEVRRDERERIVASLHSKPVPVEDGSLCAMIGELGNQLHNLGCEHQGDEALSSRLEELRSEAWRIARLSSPASVAVEAKPFAWYSPVRGFFQDERIAAQFADAKALYTHPPLSKPTPVEAGLRERLSQIASGCMLEAVYGAEWCAFPDVEFRKDLRSILAALSETLPVEREV